MNIVYLHQYFKEPTQGGGVRSYVISKGLVDKGHTVKVITGSSHIKRKMEKEVDGVKVVYLPVNYSQSFSFLARVFSFLKFTVYSTFELLSSKNVNLVIATSTPLTISIPAIINRFLRGIPYIFEVRDVWPEAPIAIGAISNKLLVRAAFCLEYFSYRWSAQVVSLSVDMQESIVSRYPRFREKSTHVITNISDISLFNNSMEASGGFEKRFCILYAGTFGAVNGLGYAIALSKMLREMDSSIGFYLMGTDGNDAECVNLAREANVYNRTVFFQDPVSKNELPSYYKAVNMGSSFVINKPQLWANSANKYFDSLAAGKPILINYGGWQRKEIHEEDIGYCLDADLSLISKIDLMKFIDYTYDIERHIVQAKNARKLAIDKYSEVLAIDSYNSICTQIDV